MDAKYSACPRDLTWIVDSGTYSRLLGLSEFLAMEKVGALATAQTSQIGFADGAMVAVTPEMLLTDTNGKMNSTTPTNNVKGTALSVYCPGRGLSPPDRRASGTGQLRHRCSHPLRHLTKPGVNHSR